MDHFKCVHGNYGECELCGDLKPLSYHAVLDEVIAELMEAIEKENKEEGVCGVRFHNNDGDERRLEDINYGYELRFKKILGKYFV